MKKLLLVIAMILIASVAFAQYTVSEVRGQPKIGEQVLVVGQSLTGSEILNLRIGNSVAITKDGVEARIAAGGNNLTVEAAYNRFLGSRISGQVVKTDTEMVQRTTRQTGTASARASDQAGENNIAEE